MNDPVKDPPRDPVNGPANTTSESRPEPSPEIFPEALPEPLPEAWLRGPIPGVHPLIAPVLYSFQQAREDLARWTEGLTVEQLWAAPHGFGSVGFHLRHIAGSTDRLMTYARGGQVTPDQLAFLKSEHDPGASREQLLAAIDQEFRRAEAFLRPLDLPAPDPSGSPGDFPKLDLSKLGFSNLIDTRSVGRKKLPATLIGLLVHVAEHTQRHVGQTISAAKWARVI